MIKTAFAVLCAVYWMTSHAHGWLRLADNHEAVKAIHIPSKATLQEAFAAEELQAYIKKAGGGKLVIRQGAAPEEEAVIIVSWIKNLAAMNKEPTGGEMELGREGISNRLDGNHLIIKGTSGS